jgi:uncharacterized protein (TIGR02118 family)
MIMVTVMYPAQDGARFDMDYYLKTHMPLVAARWKSCGLRETKVLRGVAASAGATPAFPVIAVLSFDTAEAFQRAVEQHGKEIMGDVANFTTIQPVIQVNDVLL